MNRERYNRQLILDGFGEDAQGKLAKAKVLVVGAGGLGCPVLQYLAAGGVGLIGIADDDTVSLSNLHRQILYSTNDVGQLKVDVSALRLREMNPEIQIVTHAVRITQQNVFSILANYDYIFDGSDNFATRYLINDACAVLKQPLIFAAVSGYEGQLAIFNLPDQQGKSTNYRDLFPVAPSFGEVPNCAENGVLGVLPGLMGAMAATEIVKLITNIGAPLINQLLHYNLLTHEKYQLSVVPGNDYQLPGTAQELLNMNYEHSSQHCATILEIEAKDLDRLKQTASTLLIDVRETHEVPVLDRSIFKQVPMSGFKSFLDANVEEDHIVLICQHGIRSIAAAEALSEKYGAAKNIYSLKGGISKWRNYFIK